MHGWQEGFVSISDGLEAFDPGGIPLKSYLGVLGIPGMTAYIGMLTIGEAKAGETVFVSAASGTVEAVACQIGRIKGCRVVGTAGSEGIYVYYENVGGRHLEAAMNIMN